MFLKDMFERKQVKPVWIEYIRWRKFPKPCATWERVMRKGRLFLR